MSDARADRIAHHHGRTPASIAVSPAEVGGPSRHVAWPTAEPSIAHGTQSWAPAAGDGMRPSDVLAIVRRHWLVVALCFVAALAAGAYVVARTAPVYQATATIEIDAKQSAMPEVYTKVSWSGDIATGMEVLRSWTLAAEVVDSLGLRLRLVEPASASRQTLLSAIAVSRTADTATYTLLRQPDGGFGVFVGEPGELVGKVLPGRRGDFRGVAFDLAAEARAHPAIVVRVDPFEQAVDRLRGAIAVGRPGAQASIVRLSHEGSDPLLVRDVLNALTARFVARRQAVQTAEARNAAAELRGQIDTVSRELALAERGFRRFREREQVVNPELEGNTQVTRMAELRAQRGMLEVERRALAQLLDEVNREAAQRPDAPAAYRRLAGSPTLFRQQAVSSYLNALTDVEAQRAALLTRRTPQDPDVIALTTRIDELAGQLQATASTYLDGLTRQIAGVDDELARSGRQLGAAPGRQAQFTELQRQPAVLAQTLTMLQTRLKEAQIAEAMVDPSVRVLDPAILPRRPVRPRPMRDLSLAGCLGLLLGATAALTRERFDRSVRTRHDVQVAAGISVLGLIPHIVDPRRSLSSAKLSRLGRGNGRRAGGGGALPRGALPALRSGGEQRSVAAAINLNQALEGYTRLQMNLLASRPDGVVRTLMFTSPLAGDGKTTTAVNYALALAGRGYRTLLIDADLRRGVVHSLFGLAPEPGLSSVLTRGEVLETACRKVAIERGHTLDVLPRGAVPPNSGGVLASEAFSALIADAARRYDRIVIDTPPLNAVADAALVSAHVDGVVVVVRAGVTSPDAIGYMMEQLRTVRAPVLGAVLNDMDFRHDAAYNGAYEYYADPGPSAVAPSA